MPQLTRGAPALDCLPRVLLSFLSPPLYIFLLSATPLPQLPPPRCMLGPGGYLPHRRRSSFHLGRSSHPPCVTPAGAHRFFPLLPPILLPSQDLPSNPPLLSSLFLFFQPFLPFPFHPLPPLLPPNPPLLSSSPNHYPPHPGLVLHGLNFPPLVPRLVPRVQGLPPSPPCNTTHTQPPSCLRLRRVLRSAHFFLSSSIIGCARVSGLAGRSRCCTCGLR